MQLFSVNYSRCLKGLFFIDFWSVKIINFITVVRVLCTVGE